MSIPDLIQQGLRRINDRLRTLIAALENFLSEVANAVRDICKSIARFVWHSLRQLARMFWYLLILTSVFLAPVFIGSGFHELTFSGSWGGRVIGWLGTLLTTFLLIVMIALLISHKRSSSDERKQTTIWFHLINAVALLILALGSHYQYRFRSPVLKYTQASIDLLLAKIQTPAKWFTHRDNISTPPITTSFDCAKAKTATEIAICADRDLASLDLSMVGAYHVVLDRTAPTERVEFRRQHLEWFKQYQQSCNAVAQTGTVAKLKECISKCLSEHTQELQIHINNKGASALPTGAAMPMANAFAGTHWHGNVGRSPASLDIFSTDSTGNLNARINYTGVAEDLVVVTNSEGGLVLRGTGYHRESGTGPFALDTFYGQVSQESQQIRGWLLDGSGQRGHWSVTKVVHDSEMTATITARWLSPTPTSITHWQGIVGNWPATLDVMPRETSGAWRACVTYRGVAEDLTVSVKEDGSVVFTGTSYKRVSGAGPFSLDTLYGQLSADGQTLQGLRVDATSRGQWNIFRIGVSDQTPGQRSSILP